MVRECKIHGLTEFRIRKEGGFRCKKCAVDAVTKRRQKVKLMAINYKGGKCHCCSYDKYQGALEFHHLDPTQKDFGIGNKGYTRSWEKIKIEIDKCILVCSNCHKEIHAGLIKI